MIALAYYILLLIKTLNCDLIDVDEIKDFQDKVIVSNINWDYIILYHFNLKMKSQIIEEHKKAFIDYNDPKKVKKNERGMDLLCIFIYNTAKILHIDKYFDDESYENKLQEYKKIKVFKTYAQNICNEIEEQMNLKCINDMRMMISFQKIATWCYELLMRFLIAEKAFGLYFINLKQKFSLDNKTKIDFTIVNGWSNYQLYTNEMLKTPYFDYEEILKIDNEKVYTNYFLYISICNPVVYTNIYYGIVKSNGNNSMSGLQKKLFGIKLDNSLKIWKTIINELKKFYILISKKTSDVRIILEIDNYEYEIMKNSYKKTENKTIKAQIPDFINETLLKESKNFCDDHIKFFESVLNESKIDDNNTMGEQTDLNSPANGKHTDIKCADDEPTKNSSRTDGLNLLKKKTGKCSAKNSKNPSKKNAALNRGNNARIIKKLVSIDHDLNKDPSPTKSSNLSSISSKSVSDFATSNMFQELDTAIDILTIESYERKQVKIMDVVPSKIPSDGINTKSAVEKNHSTQCAALEMIETTQKDVDTIDQKERISTNYNIVSDSKKLEKGGAGGQGIDSSNQEQGKRTYNISLDNMVADEKGVERSQHLRNYEIDSERLKKSEAGGKGFDSSQHLRKIRIDSDKSEKILAGGKDVETSNQKEKTRTDINAFGNITYNEHMYDMFYNQNFGIDINLQDLRAISQS